MAVHTSTEQYYKTITMDDADGFPGNTECVFYKFRVGQGQFKVRIDLCSLEDTSTCSSDDKYIKIFYNPTSDHHGHKVIAYGNVVIDLHALRATPLSSMTMKFTPHKNTTWEFGSKETITVSVDNLFQFTTKPISSIVSNNLSGGRNHTILNTHKKSPKPLLKTNNATATWTSTWSGTWSTGCMWPSRSRSTPNMCAPSPSPRRQPRHRWGGGDKVGKRMHLGSSLPHSTSPAPMLSAPSHVPSWLASRLKPTPKP